MSSPTAWAFYRLGQTHGADALNDFYKSQWYGCFTIILLCMVYCIYTLRKSRFEIWTQMILGIVYIFAETGYRTKPHDVSRAHRQQVTAGCFESHYRIRDVPGGRDGGWGTETDSVVPPKNYLLVREFPEPPTDIIYHCSSFQGYLRSFTGKVAYNWCFERKRVEEKECCVQCETLKSISL